MHTPAPSSLLLTLLSWLPGPGLALYQVTQLLSQGVWEGEKIFKVLSEGLIKIKCIYLSVSVSPSHFPCVAVSSFLTMGHGDHLLVLPTQSNYFLI